MKDLQKVKAIGEQLLALSVELLRSIDTDEQERAALIESVKKRWRKGVSLPRNKGGN